jgi:general secretion pathway protein D
LLDLGIQWPTSASATVIGVDGVAGQLRLSELRNRTVSQVNLNTSNPVISAQFKSQTGDATLLANPRVRVRNKQSAKILIGERVPVITTTSTANVGNSQSVSYLDVGLKLEIEPTITLDDEVSMKIALEVSNITQTITLTGGTQAYRLGTRNTSTSLQVHDGETNILAGLIQRDRTFSNTGLPGVSELPLLNRLFGVASDNDTRTEIVLLITPRIVRSLDVPGIGQQEFLSGTESSIGAGPIQLGQPVGAPRQGGSTPPGFPPTQNGRPTASSPAAPQPPRAEPQQPLPVPPSAPAAPPALTPPSLIPTKPGT